jgi:predicted RNase H-like HicB family nuclease
MLRIKLEREDDGRWIADIPAQPGLMVYGTTPSEAWCKVEILALRTFADRIEHGEQVPEIDHLFIAET